MYYRRDVLAAARLPVPETWEDLLLVARALNGSDFNNDGRAGESQDNSAPSSAICLACFVLGDVAPI